jgi:hypothetical protein
MNGNLSSVLFPFLPWLALLSYVYPSSLPLDYFSFSLPVSFSSDLILHRRCMEEVVGYRGNLTVQTANESNRSHCVSDFSRMCVRILYLSTRSTSFFSF